MPKYIDAEPLIKKFSGGECVKSLAESVADERFVEALKNAPAADVENLEVEAVKRYVAELKKHYPHSYSVCSTIDRVVYELFGDRTVRCKACKYNDSGKCLHPKNQLEKHIPQIGPHYRLRLNLPVDDEHYCSYGEKRGMHNGNT